MIHPRLVSLENLMKVAKLGQMVDAYSHLLTWAMEAEKNYRANKPLGITHESYVSSVAKLDELSELVTGFEMPVSGQYVSDFVEGMKSGTSDDKGVLLDVHALGKLQVGGQLLRNVFGVELGAKSYFTLSPYEAALIDPREPLWGADFAAKFPSTLYDLDEGAKCLAFGRSTAAVFHFMRVAEVGIRALHACLDINVPLEGNERNWGNILGRIKTEISTRPKGAGKDSLQEMYAALDAVKDAWRNATMHIEQKYTPEEAEHVYAVLRGLMKKIAARMDEKGEPKA